MKTAAHVALVVAALCTGCATGGVSPMRVGDAASSRVYWDDHAGEGYRIKVTRDAGRMGSLCMTEIHLDGKLAAEIGQAESVVFKVAPGKHELMAKPSLSTDLCKTFYSTPQVQMTQVVEGSAGEVKAYRYGFEGSGTPFLAPAP